MRKAAEYQSLLEQIEAMSGPARRDRLLLLDNECRGLITELEQLTHQYRALVEQWHWQDEEREAVKARIDRAAKPEKARAR